MAKATCTTCGWSHSGPLGVVREKLTEHHQQTKRDVSAAMINLVQNESESAKERRRQYILSKSHYPTLELP